MRASLVAFLVLVLVLVCRVQGQQPPSPNASPTQQTSVSQPPPAAPRDINGKAPRSPGVPGGTKPESGRTGEHGAAINVTTTKSTGVTTPPENPKPRPGAPPNWEQVGQMPQHADANAAKAIEAEMGGAPGGGTLGIKNVMPRYDTSRQGAQNQAAQPLSPTTAVGTPGQATKRRPAAKPTSTAPTTP